MYVGLHVNKSFWLIVILTLIILTPTGIAEDVRLSHTISNTFNYFGEEIPFTGGSIGIVAEVVNRENVKDVSIVFDDVISLDKCTSDKCQKNTLIYDEGLHTYYAVITHKDGTITTTPRTDLLFTQKTCVSSPMLKITGPGKRPLYTIANSGQKYEIQITNTFDRRDEFTLYFHTVGNWKGTFSENPVVLGKSESKTIYLTIEPDKNRKDQIQFFVTMNSQIQQKQVAFSCVYYFFGHSINLSPVPEGGNIIPSPSSISGVLIPARRIPFKDTEVQLFAQPLENYELKLWEQKTRDFFGGLSTNQIITLRMTQDWNVRVSFDTQKHVCRGTFSLSFLPSTVLPGRAATAIIKGLTADNCVGKPVFILDPENIPWSCKIEKEKQGCQVDLIAPAGVGTHAYVAKLDRNNDNDFDDVFFNEPEIVKSNLIVSSTATPFCTFFDSPKKRADNPKIYDVDVSLYNLPSDLLNIKLKCHTTFPEQVLSIDPNVLSPKKTLTCDYRAFYEPTKFAIWVSAPSISPCTTTITDFLPSQLGTITFHPGWNFISVPLGIDGKVSYKTSAFCGMSSIITIDPATKDFLFLTLDKLDVNKGYFIKVKNQCTIQFDGSIGETVSLYPGWNFFGVGIDISLSDFRALVGTKCRYFGGQPFVSSIIWVNPLTKDFEFDPQQLKTGYGYAVKLSLTEPCAIKPIEKAIKKMDVGIENVWWSKKTISSIKDEYTFSTKITNLGDLEAKNFKVTVYGKKTDAEDRIKLCDFTVDSLVAGAAKTLDCTYDVTFPAEQRILTSKQFPTESLTIYGSSSTNRVEITGLADEQYNNVKEHLMIYVK